MQRGFDTESLVLAALLIGFGVYGAVVSGKYYERFRLHVSRVGRVMERLEELALEKHKQRHPYMARVRLHRL